MQEPLVQVSVSVGCSGSVSRQFVVFADPPAAGTEAARETTVDMPAATAMSAATAATAPQPAPRPMTSAAAPTGGGRPAAKKVARRTQGEAASTPSRPRARVPALAARPELPRRSAQASVPRLKLEEPEELLKAARLTVAAQDAALASAAEAASAAQATALAAQQRLVALESNVVAMREEAAANRAAMDSMRISLAQAGEPGRMQSVLVAAVAALGALALWLAWCMRALQRERQSAWWQGAVDEAVAEPAAEAADGASAVLQRTLAAAAATNAAPLTQQFAALPTAVLVEDALTRPVNVDELIDLEQQAEFFMVLGDEDATVDLLMSHLRSTGGASPVPHLKLLEFYRRRGEREAYERKRLNVGQRFGAAAADWEACSDKARDLEDYPAALAMLQTCWKRPLEAMDELEALLFHKRGGELFDLPAYRDALTLYSVARDLHRQPASRGSDVDVFLPLPAGDPVGSDPSPWNIEDRSTVSVDLDLSEPPAPKDSRIGELSSVRATLR